MQRNMIKRVFVRVFEVKLNVGDSGLWMGTRFHRREELGGLARNIRAHCPEGD